MPWYLVHLTMAVLIEAASPDDAEDVAIAEAAAKLDSRGISCLVVAPPEETESPYGE